MNWKINLNHQIELLLSFVPSIICVKTSVELSEMTQKATIHYESDLPNSNFLDEEIIMWQKMRFRCQPDNRPSSAASALKECKPDKFPNIYIVLSLGCVLPVTTTECERTGSVIRRLHS